MIKMPHWFPDIDIHIMVRPLFSISISGTHQEYNIRRYTISMLSISLFAWRGQWLSHWGFAIYKRDDG